MDVVSRCGVSAQASPVAAVFHVARRQAQRIRVPDVPNGLWPQRRVSRDRDIAASTSPLLTNPCAGRDACSDASRPTPFAVSHPRRER
jgi:hypothetical protein